VASIKNRGLMSNEDSEIFSFTNMNVANTIARDQVFLFEYAVFKIDPLGITGEIAMDDVAEFSAAYQRIIKQSHIEPNYLRLLRKRVKVAHFDGWDYFKYTQLGYSHEGIKQLRKLITDFTITG